MVHHKTHEDKDTIRTGIDVNGDMVGTLNTERSGALVVNHGQRFFAYYTYSFKNITHIHLNVPIKYNKQYRYLSI